MADDAFRREQRAVAGRMVLGLTVTLLAVGAALALDGRGAAVPMAERLQAALRADLFVALWLGAAIANVARLRFFSSQDIGGSGSGPGSQALRNGSAVLQNTLEQAVLAFAVHLVLAATLARSGALIVALAALFTIGRVLFWAGYGRGAAGRALGFGLTFYPSLAGLVVAAASAAAGIPPSG